MNPEQVSIGCYVLWIIRNQTTQTCTVIGNPRPKKDKKASYEIKPAFESQGCHNRYPIIDILATTGWCS